MFYGYKAGINEKGYPCVCLEITTKGKRLQSYSYDPLLIFLHRLVLKYKLLSCSLFKKALSHLSTKKKK